MIEHSPFDTVLNNKLSAVVFVMDYLQLQFDGPTLNFYIWPTVLKSMLSYKFGDVGYRDQLCSLITSVVQEIHIKEEDLFTIIFHDGNKIEVSIRPESYVGPEIIELWDNQLITVI